MGKRKHIIEIPIHTALVSRIMRGYNLKCISNLSHEVYGQSVYYGLHSMFLKEDNVAMIVFDASQHLQDPVKGTAFCRLRPYLFIKSETYTLRSIGVCTYP